jgi:hypothetical protein
MTDTKMYPLVKGTFSPEDAKEITSHLISEKINFHEKKSFSNKIRFGEIDENSQVRIKELNQSRTSINELIDQAREQGKTLKIESTITIELI